MAIEEQDVPENWYLLAAGMVYREFVYIDICMEGCTIEQTEGRSDGWLNGRWNMLPVARSDSKRENIAGVVWGSWRNYSEPNHGAMLRSEMICETTRKLISRPRSHAKYVPRYSQFLEHLGTQILQILVLTFKWYFFNVACCALKTLFPAMRPYHPEPIDFYALMSIMFRNFDLYLLHFIIRTAVKLPKYRSHSIF